MASLCEYPCQGPGPGHSAPAVGSGAHPPAGYSPVPAPPNGRHPAPHPQPKVVAPWPLASRRRNPRGPGCVPVLVPSRHTGHHASLRSSTEQALILSPHPAIPHTAGDRSGRIKKMWGMGRPRGRGHGLPLPCDGARRHGVGHPLRGGHRPHASAGGPVRHRRVPVDSPPVAGDGGPVSHTWTAHDAASGAKPARPPGPS